ncbi:MAG: hypothetical protein KAJ24_03550, partial [Candidatus Aenigmarchaeota archaeon]|nr:hypothetical protein [Candidatus Aenigmarchaeota archaeon]
GRPVYWIKKIVVSKSDEVCISAAQNFSIEVKLPKTAKNITDSEGALKATTSFTTKTKVLKLSGEKISGFLSNHKKPHSLKSSAVKKTKSKTYEIMYETPAPVKLEKLYEKKTDYAIKIIDVESEASNDLNGHYRNISVSTVMPARAKEYRLLWLVGTSKIDVTKDSRFNVSIDFETGRISWMVPKLSIQSFEIQADFLSLAVTSSMESKGNWTIYFDAAGNDTLEIVNLTGGVYLSKIEQYRGGWVDVTPQTLYPVIMGWDGTTYPKGRVIYGTNYDVSESQIANITFGGIVRQVKSFNRHLQNNTDILNLDNPKIRYSLCSYNTSFWMCNAQIYSDGSFEPGYFGETYRSALPATRYFDIPRNSTIDSISLILEPVINETIQAISYARMVSSADVSEDVVEDILTATDTLVRLRNSSGVVWNYTLSSGAIKDIFAGDVDLSKERDEIVLATTKGLILLASNGSTIWNLTTAHAYTHVCVGELSPDYNLFYIGDGTSDSYKCVGCSENSHLRFTLPYTTTSANCFIKTALNY